MTLLIYRASVHCYPIQIKISYHVIVWGKNCYSVKIRCINVFIVFEEVSRMEMLGGVSLLDTSYIVIETV